MVVRRAKQVSMQTKRKKNKKKQQPFQKLIEDLCLMQCLDFTVTVYLLHLLVCVCYSGIPRLWAWWLCNIVAMIIMAVLGEYLCMRSELAAIPVGGSQGKT